MSDQSRPVDSCVRKLCSLNSGDRVDLVVAWSFSCVIEHACGFAFPMLFFFLFVISDFFLTPYNILCHWSMNLFRISSTHIDIPSLKVSPYLQLFSASERDSFERNRTRQPS